MADFQFLRPIWLLVLIPLAVVFFLLRKKNSTQSFWTDKIDPHLLPHVLVPIENNPWVKRLGVTYAFACLICILALSGPSWDQSQPVLLKPDIAPLVFILDLSPSMTVQDIQPSRLIAAQTKLHTLLNSLPPRPMALVVYSSQAYSVMPLTEDRQLIKELIPYLTPELMPSKGSHSAAGLILGGELLQQNGYSQGNLLLITDHADNHTIVQAKAQAEKGYDTSVYAIATLAGGTLMPGNSSDKDISSEIHLPLEQTSLIATAREGQGIYQRYTQSGKDLDSLLNNLSKGWTAKSDTSVKQVRIPRDQGAWLVLLLLPLVLYLFRPGWLLLLCLSLINLNPLPAVALDWSAIWYNAAQRGLQALENDHPEQAERLFSDPYLIGIAQYRQQHYAAALKNFKQVNTADAYYNQGNVLARLGRYQEALTAYTDAYQMDRSLKNAQKNARIIQQILSLKLAADDQRAVLQATKVNKNRSDIKRQAALYAEDLLDAPAKQRISPAANEKKSQHEALGKASGGATLFSDRQTSKVEEGNAIGQTASEGLDNTDSREQIARKGSSAGGGQSAVKQVTANKLLEKQTNADTTLSRQQRQDKAVGTESVQGNAFQPTEQTAADRHATDTESNETLQDIGQTESQSQNLKSRKINENFQSLQHWLDSINDNPSGLLKEKFKREFKRGVKSASDSDQHQQPW